MYDQFYDIIQILFVWLFIYFFLLQKQLRCLQKYMDVSVLLQEREKVWVGGTAEYLTRKLQGRTAGSVSGMTLSAGVHNLQSVQKKVHSSENSQDRTWTRHWCRWQQLGHCQWPVKHSLSTIVLLCIKIQVNLCQKKIISNLLNEALWCHKWWCTLVALEEVNAS